MKKELGEIKQTKEPIPRMALVQQDLYRTMHRMRIAFWGAMVYGTLGFAAAVYMYVFPPYRQVSSTQLGEVAMTVNVSANRGGGSIKKNILQAQVQSFLKGYFEYQAAERKAKQEKALWLLDTPDMETLNGLYTDWHEQVDALGLSQELSGIEISIASAQEPWAFSSTAQLAVNRTGAIPGRYLFTTKGYLVQVPADSLLNPNGLVITAFTPSITPVSSTISNETL